MNTNYMERALKEGLDKYFKLTSSISVSNMVLFNSEGKITKYNTVQEILEEFYKARLGVYNCRKEFLVSKIMRDLEILNNKKKFIIAVIEERINIRNCKKNDILRQLLNLKFT